MCRPRLVYYLRINLQNCAYLVIIFFLFTIESQAQCSDPSPSGDCDQDGIINGLDSDADNDGILDLYECQNLLVESFQSANGLSVSFVFPQASTGIYIDLYALDNSFNININGVDLVLDEFQFEPGPSSITDSDMIFASDGTRHGQSGNPNIWNIAGGPGDPVVRLKMSGDGQILILGKRFSNSALEELIIQPGDPQLNAVTWNLTSPNTITIIQEVVGPTYIDGQIFGLDCNNDSDGDGILDYLDLDSDNDSCPDAIEGDENLMYADLLDNIVIDDNVDECGIPLILSPSGQGLGTSNDPNQMSENCLRFEVESFSPSCIGEDDGYAIVHVINGIGNYLFELIPGQIVQSSNVFENLTAGSYSIIVYDTNSSFQIILNFAIDPSVIQCLNCQTISAPFDCVEGVGGSIQVFPFGGIPQYCYSMNGGQIQKDGVYLNLNAGTYVIEISDESGQSVTCIEEVESVDLPFGEYVEILCFGDSLQVGSSVYFSSGLYSDTLQSTYGCDSVINLDLQFLDLINFNQEITLCGGDSLAVGGNHYTVDGTYIDTLQSAYGCDSIIRTDLQFYEVVEFTQEINLCEGDSLMVVESVYYTTGIYLDTLQSSYGCDSIVLTNLKFYEDVEFTQEIILCEGDSLMVAESVYYTTGIYLDTLESNQGCDSIIHTDLQFNDMIEFNQEITLCEGDSLMVAESVYYVSGIYSDTLNSIQGCDSIVYTDLQFDDIIEFNQEIMLCEGDSLVVVGNIYHTSGLYMDTIQSMTGCDSIIITDLQFFEVSEINQQIMLCEGDSLMVEQSIYFSTGVYRDTLQSIEGCDSIIITALDVINHSEYSQTIELCIGDSLFVGTSVYTENGIYLDVLANALGCDSLIYTDVEFLDQIDFFQEIRICPGEFIEVGTNIYNSSGVYIDTLMSHTGCDSVVTTSVMDFENSQFFQSIELCAGDSVIVDSEVYYFSGNYVDVIMNSNGCDSTITTELIVYDELFQDQIITLCEGDSVIVGSSVYHETGTYIDSLISTAGCDSIINTNLTIQEIEQKIESYTLCEGDSIEHAMGIFYEVGMYSFFVEEENMCIYELIINIELASEQDCSTTICSAYIPNVFSPNNDGINDQFQPFSNNITFNELIIFDRWGNKLFQSNDSNPVWDGTFQNRELMPAVYVCIIKGICDNGEEVIYLNDVSLVR